MSSAYAFCDPELYASMTKRTIEDLKTFFNNPERYASLRAPRHIVRGVEVPSATALLEASDRSREKKSLEFLYADELPERSSTYLKQGAVPFPVYVGEKGGKPYFRYAYWIDSLTETAMNGVKTWIRQGLDYNTVHPDRNLSMFEAKSGTDEVVHDFFVRLGEISASVHHTGKERSPIENFDRIKARKPLFSEITSILKEHVNILDASLKIGRTLTAFLSVRCGSVTRNVMTARDLILAGSAMAVGASMIFGHINIPDIHNLVPEVLDKLHIALTHDPTPLSHPLNVAGHEAVNPSPAPHPPASSMHHEIRPAAPPHHEKISRETSLPHHSTHFVSSSDTGKDLPIANEEVVRRDLLNKSVFGIPTDKAGLSILADSTFAQSETNIKLLGEGLQFLHTLHPDWKFVLPSAGGEGGSGIYLGVIPSEGGNVSISLVREGNTVFLLHDAPEVNVPPGSTVEFHADSSLTTSITSVLGAPSKGFKL